VSDDVVWQCLISEPEGSIRLPVGQGLDLKGWSEQAAMTYLGATAPRAELRGLARVLAQLATSSELSSPTFAYAYVVDAAKAVMAVYEVHDYDDEGYDSVDRLPDLIRDVFPAEPESRHITRVVLPTGPGVRVQEIRSVVAGSLFKKKTQLESVTYAVLPPQVNNVLVLRMTWTNLVFSEALLELSQTLAESLELAEVKKV